MFFKIITLAICLHMFTNVEAISEDRRIKKHDDPIQGLKVNPPPKNNNRSQMYNRQFRHSSPSLRQNQQAIPPPQPSWYYQRSGFICQTRFGACQKPYLLPLGNRCLCYTQDGIEIIGIIVR